MSYVICAFKKLSLCNYVGFEWVTVCTNAYQEICTGGSYFTKSVSDMHVNRLKYT